MATTLKLPPELKQRIARVVEGTGQTPHAFMVDAIRRQTENAEKRREFVATARAAREEFERAGVAYDWTEVRDYYRAKLQGRRAPKPRLRNLSRGEDKNPADRRSRSRPPRQFPDE